MCDLPTKSRLRFNVRDWKFVGNSECEILVTEARSDEQRTLRASFPNPAFYSCHETRFFDVFKLLLTPEVLSRPKTAKILDSGRTVSVSQLPVWSGATRFARIWEML